MKRKGYIFEEICNLENLTAAAKEAAKGKKSSSYGVRLFLDIDLLTAKHCCVKT